MKERDASAMGPGDCTDNQEAAKRRQHLAPGVSQGFTMLKDCEPRRGDSNKTNSCCRPIGAPGDFELVAPG